MLKKLYTNSGLILVALLAAGIWTSNIQDFLASRSAPKPTFEQLPERAGQPSPTPKLSAVELFEREQRQKGATPQPFEESMRRQALNATARCVDGTYSYSVNRRATCAGHRGVAQWLAR
jgi:hypothetical protein